MLGRGRASGVTLWRWAGGGNVGGVGLDVVEAVDKW
jgi:hypothetical protein